MKIHSSFYDYYDRAVAYGADPNLHYVRKQEDILYTQLRNKLPVETVSQIGRGFHSNSADLSLVLVGFCGKLFPAALFRLEHWPTKDESYWDIKTLEECSWYGNFSKWQKHDIGKHFQEHLIKDDIFLEIEAPIFYIFYDWKGRKRILRKNPNLRELSFQKVIDPFTAFQEISMYLGNILVKQDRPDDVEDKYKVSQHGFDPIYSFRKRPSDV